MGTSETVETPRFWYERGAVLPAAKQLAYYTAGLARDPAFHPWAECGIGVAHAGMGDHAAAIEHLEKAIQLAPTLSRAWNNLGLARQARQDWAGAVDAFEAAARHDPGQPVIIDNLHQAQKGLARQRQREQFRGQAGALKPLHRYLMVAALVGAVINVAFNLLFDYFQLIGTLHHFFTNYSWLMNLLWYAQSACLVAGLVGLWLAKGRSRPWVLAGGIACVLVPFLDIILLYAGLEYCTFEMLGLLAYGTYYALYGMTWRGRTFPKVLVAVQCVLVAVSALVYFGYGCTFDLPGYAGSPLQTAVRVAYLVDTLTRQAVLQLRAGFWVTTLQQPPLVTLRPALPAESRLAG